MKLNFRYLTISGFHIIGVDIHISNAEATYPWMRPLLQVWFSKSGFSVCIWEAFYLSSSLWTWTSLQFFAAPAALHSCNISLIKTTVTAENRYTERTIVSGQMFCVLSWWVTVCRGATNSGSSYGDAISAFTDYFSYFLIIRLVAVLFGITFFFTFINWLWLLL